MPVNPPSMPPAMPKIAASNGSSFFFFEPFGFYTIKEDSLYANSSLIA
jgi:hypothetical protein